MDNKTFKRKITILKKNALEHHMEPKYFDFLPEDFYQVNKDQLVYMWHFLSDKDIAELYEIPAYKVKIVVAILILNRLRPLLIE